MTTTYDAPTLEATIDVAAPPQKVWQLVSDLPRMASWSPQVVRTVMRGPVRPGTRALNINRSGWKVWPTRSQVVELEPERRIAFRVADNWLHWSYELEATPTGTRVVHRREAPDGLSPVSGRFQKLFMGGQETFDAEVLAGMRKTLDRIRAEAEA